MGTWSSNNAGKPDLTDNARASIDLLADRIDNCEDGLDGTDSLDAVDINGGAIDGTTIGATTPDDGTFTKVDVDNININGNDITSTNTNGDINITPNGTGQVTFGKMLGSWSSETVAENTAYQAVSDIIVSVIATYSSGDNYILVNFVTDSNSSPTTVVGTYSSFNSVATIPKTTILMPVKKGDYWKVQRTAGGTLTYTGYSIPLGA